MPWRIPSACGINVRSCTTGSKVRCCIAVHMRSYSMSVLNRSRLAGHQHADMEGGGTTHRQVAPSRSSLSAKDMWILCPELVVVAWMGRQAMGE